MAAYRTHVDMLTLVANALGPDLCEQVTFVGGCTTGLLLTDDYTREQVRYTDDVDLIVHIAGRGAFAHLQEQLRSKGFTEPAIEDDRLPICAMMLKGLRVDIMPDDEQILGFSNRWYSDAIKTAVPYELTGELRINLIHPVYFIATKLEAYKGRGQNDVLSSPDIEDLLNLIDGRPELLDEVRQAAAPVRAYIAEEISTLLHDSNFEYAVSGQGQSPEREALLFERLEALAVLGSV